MCVDCSDVAKAVVEVAPSIPRKPKPKAEVAPKAGPQAGTDAVVSSDLFKGLSREACAELAGRMPRRTVGAGEFVFEKGQPGDDMYFVVSGAAEVLMSLDAVPVAVMGPGECFGEMVLLSRQSRSAWMRAQGELTLLSLSRAMLGATMKQHPSLAPAIKSLMAERMKANEKTAKPSIPRKPKVKVEPEPEPEVELPQPPLAPSPLPTAPASPAAASQKATACLACSKPLQLYDSTHPRHIEVGAIPGWECDACSKEMNERDELFGCPTFDECDYCVCVDCVETRPQLALQQSKAGTATEDEAALAIVSAAADAQSAKAAMAAKLASFVPYSASDELDPAPTPTAQPPGLHPLSPKPRQTVDEEPPLLSPKPQQAVDAPPLAEKPPPPISPKPQTLKTAAVGAMAVSTPPALSPKPNRLILSPEHLDPPALTPKPKDTLGDDAMVSPPPPPKPKPLVATSTSQNQPWLHAKETVADDEPPPPIPSKQTCPWLDEEGPDGHTDEPPPPPLKPKSAWIDADNAVADLGEPGLPLPTKPGSAGKAAPIVGALPDAACGVCGDVMQEYSSTLAAAIGEWGCDGGCGGRYGGGGGEQRRLFACANYSSCSWGVCAQCVDDESAPSPEPAPATDVVRPSDIELPDTDDSDDDDRSGSTEPAPVSPQLPDTDDSEDEPENGAQVVINAQARDQQRAAVEANLRSEAKRGSPPEEEPEESEDQAVTVLRQELLGLKMTALQKRASWCVDEQVLEEAVDSGDPQSRLIELIVQAAAASGENGVRQGPQSLKLAPSKLPDTDDSDDDERPLTLTPAPPELPDTDDSEDDERAVVRSPFDSPLLPAFSNDNYAGDNLPKERRQPARLQPVIKRSSSPSMVGSWLDTLPAAHDTDSDDSSGYGPPPQSSYAGSDSGDSGRSSRPRARAAPSTSDSGDDWRSSPRSTTSTTPTDDSGDDWRSSPRSTTVTDDSGDDFRIGTPSVTAPEDDNTSEDDFGSDDGSVDWGSRPPRSRDPSPNPVELPPFAQHQPSLGPLDDMLLDLAALLKEASAATGWGTAEIAALDLQMGNHVADETAQPTKVAIPVPAADETDSDDSSSYGPPPQSPKSDNSSTTSNSEDSCGGVFGEEDV